MKIYNTLTRQKQEFVPLHAPNVTMYACGITVSGKAHIGHLYQAYIYDIFRKFLEKQGYNVTYARNYTDIDDKIIAAANQTHTDATLYAQQMIQNIDEIMQYFQIDEPNLWLRATETVDDIIAFVQTLIHKGHAYVTENGDVYFSVESFPGYGKLSNRNIEESLHGVRIDNDEQKRSPLDFALWKSAKPGEPSWPSPWGEGRPGWHIECSAMNLKAFGEQIDIHGGGRDLIFPHHENEIAQTEALTGKPFVKYWTHNGLIKVNGQKMSKSLGNSILLEDLKKRWHPEVVKFALLQTNYRNDINITESLFEEAEKHMYHFHSILRDVDQAFASTLAKNESIDKEFDEAMADDFNTAKVVANLFSYFKTLQQKVKEGDASALADARAIRQTYGLLGLFINPSVSVLAFIDAHQKQEIPEEIQQLAEKRWQAKLQKNWAEADALRANLLAKGYEIKDAATEYTIVKK